MSTDQALIEALEEHHKEAMDRTVSNAPMLTEDPAQPLSQTAQRIIRMAFLAGTIEQAKNQLPPIGTPTLGKFYIQRLPLAPRTAIEEAYLRGFSASGEGWNGEYPFDKSRDPEKDAKWVAQRELDLEDLQP